MGNCDPTNSTLKRTSEGWLAKTERETKQTEKMPVDAALIVCGLTNNDGDAEATAVAAFEHEGMTNVAIFANMTCKDVIEMCKTINDQAMNQNGCPIGALKAKHVSKRLE